MTSRSQIKQVDIVKGINEELDEILLHNHVPEKNLFDNIIQKLAPIDFYKEAGLNKVKGEKMTRPTQIIIIINKVLSVTKLYGFELMIFQGAIYIYTGKYWKEANESQIKHFLKRAAIKMGLDEFVATYYRFVDDLFKQFQSSANFQYKQPSATSKINLENGTYTISTTEEKLAAHSPKDNLRYILPYEYNPKAKAIKFHKYLDRVLPDQNLQNILAEFLGYCLDKSLKLEKGLVLLGDGANGKSVFSDITNAVLGSENVSSYSIKSITDPSSKSRIKLKDKLLNASSETSSKANIEMLKTLFSGEPVEAPILYKQTIIMVHYCRFMLNANKMPGNVEQSHGFFRRFLIIPFDTTITESEKDPDLAKNIIKDELPGVFNWILEGLRRLRKNRKFTSSKKTDDALSNYKTMSDSVKQYMEETNYKHDETGDTLDHMYQDYLQFCILEGCMKVRRRTFAARIRSLGYEMYRRSDGMMVKAIK